MSQDCSRFREAISAGLDGEDAGVPAYLLARHLRGCAECREFQARVTTLNRATRLRPAEVVPDLTPRILAGIDEARSSVRRRAVLPVRLGLAVIGVAQVVLTAPQLFGAQDALDAPSHIAHELGSFGVALGIGFISVAWRPLKAAGLTALSTVVALGIAVTAGADLVRGVTTISHELDHLPEIAGFVLVWILAASRPGPTHAEPRAMAEAA